VTISGIAMAKSIKKEQFKTGKLGGPRATMTELWNVAQAAKAAPRTTAALAHPEFAQGRQN
jgi:hypothetical protein